MQLIKDLCSYKDQVEKIYEHAFNDTKIEMQYIIAMLDLTQAYGYIDSDHLVTMVCPVERALYDSNGEIHRIVNLTCLATSQADRGKGYGLKLMHEVANKLVNLYDSVVWQTEHWNIYKSFDLIECTNKIECQYIPGLYPTPMLMIWDQPNVDLMLEIEIASSQDTCGIKQAKEQVQLLIEMYQAMELNYLANPGAYIWYDKNTKKIIHLQYSNLANLTWLMHQIQPNGSFYLFKENDLKEFPCLLVTDNILEITKTYKSSKKHFKNIKLNDFLI